MSKTKIRNENNSTGNHHRKTNDVELEQGMTIYELTHAGLEYPNVWDTAAVSIVPEKWISSWWIIRIVGVPRGHEHFGFHFVGWNVREHEGAVSSKIEKFDPATMSGLTRSGRVYRLVGLPGFDPDADYVLSYWLDANKAEAENATDEFIRKYGVSLKHIEKLSN